MAQNRRAVAPLLIQIEKRCYVSGWSVVSAIVIHGQVDPSARFNTMLLLERPIEP